MMQEPAHRLGISLLILDEGDSPAKQLSSSNHHVDGTFRDKEKIVELASKCQVVTVEIEHVDARALRDLSIPVEPSPETIEIIQDKYRQKLHLRKNDIPTPDFIEVSSRKTVC